MVADITVVAGITIIIGTGIDGGNGSDASTCRCIEAASTVRAAARSSRLDWLRMHQKYLYL